jgi:adenosine deaminase
MMTRDDWAVWRTRASSTAPSTDWSIGNRFFTPARHLAGGQDLADIVAGLDEGFTAAEAETGVTCRLIADMDRAFGRRRDWSWSSGWPSFGSRADWHRAGDRRGHGLDRARGRSGDVPSRLPGGSRRRVPATAHQGENSPATAVAAAIDVLGVDRVDHGFSILGDPELVARVAAMRIPLTVCPNSNVRIANVFARLEDHGTRSCERAGCSPR